MKLIRGIHNLPQLGASAVTIGNFDGMHLGHQRLFSTLKQQAQQLQIPSVVILFEPTPKEYFLKDKAPVRLSSLRDKLMELERLEIDYVIIQNFTPAFAKLSPTEFIEKGLLRLGVKYLIVGHDFRFGYQRQGDYDLLATYASQHDFSIASLPAQTLDEKRISSTWLRECLAKNDFTSVSQLLGQRYRMTGRVIHGEKLGRQLGFPTVNIKCPGKIAPLHGVYAVKVLIEGLDGEYLGAASIGTRPTVGGKQWLLEVHLLDFDKMLYGKLITVEFLQFIRKEEKFASLDILKEKLCEDVRRVSSLDIEHWDLSDVQI